MLMPSKVGSSLNCYFQIKGIQTLGGKNQHQDVLDGEYLNFPFLIQILSVAVN